MTRQFLAEADDPFDHRHHVPHEPFPPLHRLPCPLSGCGGLWWFIGVHGGFWWFVRVCGGLWWFMGVRGGLW